MTRDQWLRRYAERMIDKAQVDAGEAAALSRDAAETQIADNGRNPAMWANPAAAADEELSYWAEQ